MARATRLPLVEREVRERLSTAAVELLLGQAQVMSEGQRAASPSAGQAFFGTVMITIDLDAAAAQVREEATPETAARIAALMSTDGRVQGRVRRVAEAEASRLASVPIRVKPGDVRVRAQGTRVLIDVEVEG